MAGGQVERLPVPLTWLLSELAAIRGLLAPSEARSRLVALERALESADLKDALKGSQAG